MTQSPEDEELRGLAKKRLQTRRAFWEFLVIWVGVSALCIGIWFFTTGFVSYFWPIWPIAGMGIGALSMGWAAYGPVRRLITDADIDNEVRKLRGQ